MFTSNTILSFGFYKYNKPFSGSCNGTRYRIMKVSEEDTQLLKLWMWPEPFSFEKTDEKLFSTIVFPYSEEGYAELLAYLNEHLV